MSAQSRQLLDGVRVIELTHYISGPFAGSLLGDFGAEVIKVESPASGDPMRSAGPSAAGVNLWWAVSARNKKSLTLNLKTAQGADLFRQLLAQADVLIDNMRTGSLDRLGLSDAEMKECYPRLIWLDITGYGNRGPYSERRGFGKLAEAFSGATELTGFRDEPPVHPGYSLGDLTTGMLGAFAVLLALRARDQMELGGQRIDLAIYDALFRMIEWQLPFQAHGGVRITRNGPNLPFSTAFSTELVLASDGKAVAASVGSGDMMDRFAAFIAKATGAELKTLQERLAAWRAWAAGRPADDIVAALVEAGVPAEKVHGPADLLHNPHLEARADVIALAHDALGDIPMPSVAPKMEKSPGRVKWPGPELGAHTDEILRGLLGLSSEAVAALRRQGVI